MPVDEHTLVPIGEEIYQLASFRHRLGARAIDVGLILTLANFGAVPLFARTPVEWQWMLYTCLVVAALAYLTIGEAWMKGVSVGKRLSGLRVMRITDGAPPTVWGALIRSINSASLLSVPGLMFAAFEGPATAVDGNLAVVYSKPYEPPVPMNPETFGPPPGRVKFDDLEEFLEAKFGKKNADRPPPHEE